jgi:two-component system, NtrC family, response regulator HydG
MRILVVDDDRSVREVVTKALSEDGFDVLEAPDAETAIELARSTTFDIVFSDVRMRRLSGFDLLRVFKQELQLDAEIVLMTGHASVEAALEAVTAGAHDYIVKPFSIADLTAVAASIAERRRMLRAAPAELPEDEAPFADLVGRSAPMIDVFKEVGRVAPTDLSVLIQGASGTGKEVIARTIHAKSRMSGRPFVAVNCGALTESLLDSELFGYVRGAFTGAAADRPGLFEVADGGTILLDEVTETSAAFQVKLLRVLQEGEVRRVGSNSPVKIHVRVLATTNRDAEALADAGQFRVDLLYRLNAVTIKVPPLRERTGDIDLMVASFMKRFRPLGSQPLRISHDALERLREYHWPGNVRELRHTVQRLVALNKGGVISVMDLPEKILGATGMLDRLLTEASEAEPRGQKGPPEGDDGRRWPQLSDVEARYVDRVLHHTGGNQKSAAEILGVDRKTLARMVERHGLDLDAIRQAK